MKRAWLLGLTFCGLSIPAAAPAAVVFNFDNIVSSSGTPSGSLPWATLTIMNGAVDTVNFSFTFNSGSATEYISILNLNSTTAVTSGLALTNTNKFDGFDLDGDNGPENQSYDIAVHWSNSNSGGGINRFKVGQTVTWSFSGAGLTEDDFNTLSSGGDAENHQYALAHIQGIAPDGSAWVSPGGDPVPEPASMLALGLGAAALIRRRRKQVK